MDNKKLSIIIPHYNSSELAKKLIDSIPMRDEIQVILVDDNSSEDTEGLKLHALAHNVEFYKSDSEIHSAGHCRNIGLSHAVGEWLLFADADDYFTDCFYEIISPYFEQEYDIVFFASTSINLSDGTMANRHISMYNMIHNYVVSPVKENEVHLRYDYVGPVAKIIRGDMVREQKILFDETRVANDVMFSMKTAVCAKRIAASEEVIYCITKQGGTLITSAKSEDVRMRLKIAIKKYKYLKKHIDKEAWKILDLRGDRYTKLFKKYKMSKKDIVWSWGYMLLNGVRPCISRKVTIRNVIPKIVGKVFKKK